MFQKEQLELLKQFVLTCKSNPTILHAPDLEFFKEWLLTLDAKLPDKPKDDEPKAKPAPEPTIDDDESEDEEMEEVKEEEKEEEKESEDEELVESDVDIEILDGLIEGEKDRELEMGDDSLEVTEEMMDASSDKRSEAMSLLSEGDFEGAIAAFTEAIKKNPQSANMYAKRASVLLKAKQPSAAIRDCEKAITINKDSAQPYKWRGRAYRLLGKYVEAYHDFQKAASLDCDEQAIEWKKEVEPNAKKIMEHTRKYERLRGEQERNRKIKEVKRRREAAQKEYERAQKQEKKGAAGGFPGGFPGGMGGMPGMPGMGGMPGMPGMGGMPGGAAGAAGGGMPDLSALFSDPEVMSAMQDPEVMAAFQDVSKNPENMSKYENNPKIKSVIEKLQSKFGGGMGGGMPGGGCGMPSGMPGGGCGGKTNCC